MAGTSSRRTHCHNYRHFALAILLVSVTGGVTLAPVWAAATTTPIQVSGASPLSGCTSGSLHNPSEGSNYANTSVEPRVAVAPAPAVNGPRVLIGVWQQDRWSNGGARGIVAGASHDGGKTWSETVLPFGACALPTSPYIVSSDPWITIGPDGRAYVSALVVSDAGSAVQVTTSLDGGRTWSPVRSVVRTAAERGGDDKPSITADPSHPGRAYVVWAHFPAGSNAPFSAWFSRTANGGRTWSAPERIVHERTPGGGTQGNQIIVDLRTGAVYDFFSHVFVGKHQRSLCRAALCSDRNAHSGGRVLQSFVSMITSTDGGKTWTAPRDIKRFTGAIYPDTSVRTGDPGPQAGIDPGDGTLYLLWTDGRPSAELIEETVLSRSTDGGKHWSTPLIVNLRTGAPTFTPSLAVSQIGTLGVTYFTAPVPPDQPISSPTSRTVAVSYWFTESSDGGKHFDVPVRLAGPFDMTAAPDANGHFLGDYQGLVALGTLFQAFFAMPSPTAVPPLTSIYSLGVGGSGERRPRVARAERELVHAERVFKGWK